MALYPCRLKMPDSVSACRMVHDDVYKVIKYTVQKTMSGDLAQRALDWWAGLVEHLFGLPARTPEQEKAVVPAAEDHSERNKVPPSRFYRFRLTSTSKGRQTHVQQHLVCNC